MSLENGASFDSLCGDEVGVVLQGVEEPVTKYSKKSRNIILDVSICENHMFQLLVLEYSFPRKVTHSSWISYKPSIWFDTTRNLVPWYDVIWESGTVVVRWWENVVLDARLLDCLIYVDFLNKSGSKIHSIMTPNEKVLFWIPIMIFFQYGEQTIFHHCRFLQPSS